MGAWALLAAFFSLVVPGWASTVIPIYLICGVQLVCLGIMGEYIGKIYHETKRRSRYTIEAALPENDKKNGASPLSHRILNRQSRENFEATKRGSTDLLIQPALPRANLQVFEIGPRL
jgi:hypothetical protein